MILIRGRNYEMKAQGKTRGFLAAYFALSFFAERILMIYFAHNLVYII